MWKKFLNLFKVKEDDTLNYIKPEAFAKKETGRFSQEEEDAFFRQLEAEDLAIEQPQTQDEERAARASTLQKMLTCMKERDWNPKHHPKIIIALALALIIGVIVSFALRETPNPLLGKWRPQKQSNVFVPTGDIEFRKEAFHANNVNTPIKYDIETGYVTVIDMNTKMRIPFYFKDDKTIECTILGVKTLYKKVEK
jgi:hypothetical protein